MPDEKHQLTFDVIDDCWPKLRVVAVVKLPDGRQLVFEDKVLYDQAYNKFENTLHNALRPLIEAVVKRRLAQNTASAAAPNLT